MCARARGFGWAVPGEWTRQTVPRCWSMATGSGAAIVQGITRNQVLPVPSMPCPATASLNRAYHRPTQPPSPRAVPVLVDDGVAILAVPLRVGLSIRSQEVLEVSLLYISDTVPAEPGCTGGHQVRLAVRPTVAVCLLARCCVSCALLCALGHLLRHLHRHAGHEHAVGPLALHKGGRVAKLGMAWRLADGRAGCDWAFAITGWSSRHHKKLWTHNIRLG